jgi:polyhydroxybutyrate depolymerase
LTNSVELRWPSCPSNFYQLAWTTNLQQWQPLTPPLAAPETNSVMTWTTPTSLPYQFFQLVVRPLTNAPVPTNSGIYPGRTLTHDGITRTYRLVIPQGITNGMEAPLMLALHGHNQTADSFANNIPNLSTYANNAGVILVFPNGTDDQNGTGWNVIDPTPENPVDDVAFLLALIDELDETLNIDRKRVYAGGFSNGGQMCHRLAARTTNVFAAFAAVGSAVAGTFGTDTLIYQPPPLEPNSMFIVNATNDCKRPFWGGTNVDGSLQPPARDSLTHWTSASLCTPSPVLSTNIYVTNHINRVFAECGGPYPPFNSPRTNLVIREHYQLTCTPGTEVLFVTLTDGGHAWVEAADNVGFDTSREVLEFFLRHCRCDAIGAMDSPLIPTAPGQHELRLCDQGYSRLFRLQVPAGYNPAVAAPLAFVFHGGQQTVAEFSAQHPGLFTKANLENVLLVLPQATVHPVTGGTLWGDRPFDTVVDDVSFVTNLLEHLDATLNVDRLRIYGAGFSSGGEFCNWMAGTTTGLLAAIAPVCAQTGWNEPDRNGPTVTPPPPLEPIAVLMVRGGVDPKRPFNGGANVDGVLCRSAADDVAYWTSGSACAGAPVITSAAGVMRWEYGACAGTTEVILVRVDALGHAWPDAAPFNANVQVIDFLLSHSR